MSYNEMTAPLIRRAVIDTMADLGGELNDMILTEIVNKIGYQIALRDMRQVIDFLQRHNLIKVEALGKFLVVRLLADGRDVSAGRMTVDGVSKFRTDD